MGVKWLEHEADSHLHLMLRLRMHGVLLPPSLTIDNRNNFSLFTLQLLTQSYVVGTEFRAGF
jgi:hypothetical protein